MDLTAKIGRVVKTYINAFNSADADAIAELYAIDATIEDPAGTPLKKGTQEIHKFYEKSVQNRAQFIQEGTTRIVGNEAAFAFTVQVAMERVSEKSSDVLKSAFGMEIDVITVMTFDEDGKIRFRKSYWGPSNITHPDVE